jgi:hypothetical protein
VLSGGNAEVESQLGAESLQLVPGDAVVPSEWLTTWLTERGWFEVVLERPTMADMRELDTRLVSLLTEGPRHTWVQRIAHYQRAVAGGSRVVWLTDVERESLKSSAALEKI